MPSLLHQGLVQLFRNQRSLAPRLLQAVGVALPPHATTDVEEKRATFSEVQPPDYAADLVVEVGRGDERISLVVEIQLQPDVGKRGTWPLYVAHLWHETRRPVLLVVVTLDRGTERACDQPIVLVPAAGDRAATVVHPLVVGPSSVPVVTDLARALAEPELALLSTLVHRDDPVRALPIAETTLDALEMRADPQRDTLWLDLIVACLSPTTLQALHDRMTQHTGYISQTFRDLVDQGRVEGREEGRAEGREEGRALGLIEAILEVLEARGLSVSPEQRARVEASRDLHQLHTWLTRAATVDRVEALFG